MNISELARRLKVPVNELRQKLPAMGFDVGQKAIKVDDRVAGKIIENWRTLNIRYEEQKKQENKEEKAVAAVSEKKASIPAYITVRDLAVKLNLPVNKVLAELMKNGVLASMNEKIDFDTAAIIGSEFGFSVEQETTEEEEQKSVKILEERKKNHKPENLQPRAPVVVVMGHVDHGKTKLLDAVRKTNVVAMEYGGITQHIGAYQIEKNGRQITFIDTPGHEAFTTMRSRGARVADVAILVIAADDGFKPQTEESLKIIKSAKLPMVVAINKIDKPDANPDRIKQQLAERDLTPEEWGGKTIVAPISAKENIGIDGLLDLVLLIADMEKENLQAHPDDLAIGTAIESHIDKGLGPVATVLVQNGSLKIGDGIWANQNYYGRVRGLRNFNQKKIQSAGPSVPAQIIGLKAALTVGDIIQAGEQKKGKIDKYRLQRQATGFVTERQEEETEENQYLNLIIKADTLGSLEAIIASLENLSLAQVKIKIVSRGLGNISNTDVEQAQASSALLLGFHVSGNAEVLNFAMERKVEIKIYNVIYHLLEEVKKRVQALVKQEMVIVEIGRLKVLATFRKEADFIIAGGEVTKGSIKTGCRARVIRDDIKIAEGKIEQLQQNKINVGECRQGMQCGFKFIGKPIIKAGDFLEFFMEEAKA
ncbi:translation initiation factor IF-2 [Candidatus Parcubacteria bacterium]|nr:MAG: translation initiation factor IF-2 [Candidatus Parcubacteria bacterium]